MPNLRDPHGRVRKNALSPEAYRRALDGYKKYKGPFPAARTRWPKSVEPEFVPPPYLPTPHVPDVPPSANRYGSAFRIATSTFLPNRFGYTPGWGFARNDEDRDAWAAMKETRLHTRRYDAFYMWCGLLKSLYRLKVFGVLDYAPFHVAGPAYQESYERAAALISQMRTEKRRPLNEP